MKKYTSVIVPVIAFTLAFTVSFLLIFKWLDNRNSPTDKELYEAIARGIDTEMLAEKELQGKWIKLLNERNPELHDAVIAAMLLSKDINTEIFLHHNTKEDRKLKYVISDKRGDAENILSYNHKTHSFSFDHYSEKDGPSMQTVEDREVINKKINKYYEELGVK